MRERQAFSMTLLLIIIVLIILFGGGGHYYNRGSYRTGGFGIAGLLVIVLLILWLTGNLHV
jgi:hypothetical protein